MGFLPRWVKAASVGTALAAGFPATAQFAYEEYNRTGAPYFQFDAGGVIAPDFNLTSFNGLALARPQSSWNPGFRFDIAAGWELVPAFAIELDAGVLRNSVDAIGGMPLSPVNLSLYQTPLLVNLVYSWSTREVFTGYIGAGVGGVFTTATFHFPATGDLSDTDLAFGYQAVAGMKYSINPRMDVGLAYKFLGTTSQSWADEGVRFSADGILTHSFMATFSLRF